MQNIHLKTLKGLEQLYKFTEKHTKKHKALGIHSTCIIHVTCICVLALHAHEHVQMYMYTVYCSQGSIEPFIALEGFKLRMYTHVHTYCFSM